MLSSSLPLEEQSFTSTDWKPPPLCEHAVEIHIDVPDEDADYRELLARGVEFEEPPANRSWGAHMAAFRDPEGFAIEILSPPDPDEQVPSYYAFER